MQADTSVEGFLQSLGLEKYAITFQAEEVCSFMLCSGFCTFAPFLVLSRYINYRNFCLP